MKKSVLFLTVTAAVMLLAGCQRSSIIVEGNETAPDGVVLENPGESETTTLPETTPYTIPEGATGPADVTLGADAYAGYSEDKKPQTTDEVNQIRYFYINSKGLNEDYDVLINEECNAENLNKLLINVGVVAEGTEVLSFEQNGGDAVLTLNQLEGQSSYANEENLAQAIANTMIENLFLDTLTIKVGDKTYGPLEYAD